MQNNLRFAPKSSVGHRLRPVLDVIVFLFVISVAAACSGKDNGEEELLGSGGLLGEKAGKTGRHLGTVIADEPQAAAVGKRVLERGGSAVDAAIATYFTLSVTLPSRAGLGGGGACVVYDAASGKVGNPTFFVRQPEGRPQAFPIPGNPRGFFELHERYGKMPWKFLVEPAERLARYGSAVSGVLADDLAATETILAGDQVGKPFLTRVGGQLLQAGDSMEHRHLANILTWIKERGPDGFYGGPVGQRVLNAIDPQGGKATLQKMANYRVTWNRAVRVSLNDDYIVYAAAPPAAAGLVTATILGIMAQNDRYEDADGTQQYHFVAEMGMRAFSDRTGWMLPDGNSRYVPQDLVKAQRLFALSRFYNSRRHANPEKLNPPPARRPETPASTTIVVTDFRGNSISCGLTMNGLFGVGRMIPGAGFYPALRTGDFNGGPHSIGPLVVLDDRRRVVFSGASRGGKSAPVVLANVAGRVLLLDQPIKEAGRAARVYHPGNPDRTFIESRASGTVQASLRGRRHRTTVVQRLGIINAISCPDGIPGDADDCTAYTDSRGKGMAATLN